MITKQTKEYGDLFRQASEDLKKYNTSYQLISDPNTQDKTPILKTNYVFIILYFRSNYNGVFYNKYDIKNK